MGTPITDSDLALFQEMKSGDVKPYELLFDRYYQPLCNFAYLFLKNEELCEELVSDVFLKIWIKKDEIVIVKSLKSFLYKSTRNAVISEIRKNKPDFVYDYHDVVHGDNMTPETLMLKKEVSDAIDDLVGGLPRMAGLVFRLKKIDGLRHKEIAEILNISEKTVENHITIAIKKIREVLTLNPSLKKFFSR